MNLRKLPKQAVDWYSVKAAASGEPAEVFIYDQIGGGFWSDGVTPAGLIDDIKDLKLKDSDTLHVRINSPGGNFFDGNTIYNYLRSIKQTIEVTVDGMAASAASVIAMAGDTIRMPENSFLMIHNPSMLAIGDAREMRKAADDLDGFRDSAVKTYMERTGDNVSRDELITMLDDETWLPADLAVSLGFADEVLEPVRAAALAKFHLMGLFQHVPDALNSAKVDDLRKRRQQRTEMEAQKKRFITT